MNWKERNLAVHQGSIDREFEMACGAVVMLTHGKERTVELWPSCHLDHLDLVV